MLACAVTTREPEGGLSPALGDTFGDTGARPGEEAGEKAAPNGRVRA
jgi:hypothetical protein